MENFHKNASLINNSVIDAHQDHYEDEDDGWLDDYICPECKEVIIPHDNEMCFECYDIINGNDGVVTKQQKDSAFIVIACLILGMLLLIFSCQQEAMAYEPIDMGKIIEIESGGDSNAVSHAGAIGICQITSPALIDYNEAHDTSFTMEDLYTATTNLVIGTWYIQERIPAMLGHYLPNSPNIEPTKKLILMSYVWGVGNVKYWYALGQVDEQIPEEVQEYLRRHNND